MVQPTVSPHASLLSTRSLPSSLCRPRDHPHTHAQKIPHSDLECISLRPACRSFPRPHTSTSSPTQSACYLLVLRAGLTRVHPPAHTTPMTSTLQNALTQVFPSKEETAASPRRRPETDPGRVLGTVASGAPYGAVVRGRHLLARNEGQWVVFPAETTFGRVDGFLILYRSACSEQRRGSVRARKRAAPVT